MPSVDPSNSKETIKGLRVHAKKGLTCKEDNVNVNVPNVIARTGTLPDSGGGSEGLRGSTDPYQFLKFV